MKKPVTYRFDLEKIANDCLGEMAGSNLAAVRRKRRNPAPVSLALQVAMFICREAGGGVNRIGKIFNRDHGSVSYNCRTVRDLISVYPEFKSRVEGLKSRLLTYRLPEGFLAVPEVTNL